MTDLRDIKLAQKKKEAGFAVDNQPVKANLVEVNGSTKVPNHPGWVWAKDQNGGVMKVFNPRVADRVGLPVLVSTESRDGRPGQPEVLDVDWASLSKSATYDGQPYYKNHAITHEWRGGFPGPDAMILYPSAWAELMVSPAGGLMVHISPLRYICNGELAEFAGARNVDMSGYAPAVGEARWVLISLDRQTGELTYTPGSVGIDKRVAVLPRPLLPAGSIPAAYVRIGGETTALTWQDILSARSFMNGAGDDSASEVFFDNTDSGLTADNVQEAIDEVISGFSARVRAVVLTGLSTVTNAAITATDSVLAAFGKLQAQITGLLALDGGKVSKLYESDGGAVALSADAAGNLSAAGNIDFNGFKAIAMACDSGSEFPSAQNTGQWFYRDDISILFFYDGVWKPIISFAPLNVYVDSALGADTPGNGYASESGAAATLAYAWSLIPSIFIGDVVVNMAVGNYTHPGILSGKTPGGDYDLIISGSTQDVLPTTSPTSVYTGSSTANASLTVAGMNWGIGIVADSGTNSSVVTNKLVDSIQNFASTVKRGMQVKNITDNTWAHVLSVDSNTAISLDVDIFTGTGKSYQIGWGEFKGHILRFDDDTTTSSLRGTEHLIYEHDSNVLTIVGRIQSALGTLLTPTISDTFTIIKPVTVFNGVTGSTNITQDITYRHIELDIVTAYRNFDNRLILDGCWVNRCSIQPRHAYINFINTFFYNRSGSSSSPPLTCAETLIFFQGVLFTLTNYSTPRFTTFFSWVSQSNEKMTAIFEGSSTNAVHASYFSVIQAVGGGTSWQIKYSSTGILLGQSLLISTDPLYTANTTNKITNYLPAGDMYVAGQLTVTGAVDAIQAIVKGYSGGQTANLQEWQNSTGTAVAYVDKAGAIKSSGWRRAVVTKTANYTATVNDEVIVCNHATTAFTITLPAATGTGQSYTIKNIGAAVVTVDASGSETIDGATTKALNQWGSVDIIDYGSGAWAII